MNKLIFALSVFMVLPAMSQAATCISSCHITPGDENSPYQAHGFGSTKDAALNNLIDDCNQAAVRASNNSKATGKLFTDTRTFMTSIGENPEDMVQYSFDITKVCTPSN